MELSVSVDVATVQKENAARCLLWSISVNRTVTQIKNARVELKEMTFVLIAPLESADRGLTSFHVDLSA